MGTKLLTLIMAGSLWAWFSDFDYSLIFVHIKNQPNTAEILTELEMEDLIIDQAPKLHTLIDRVREIPETAKYIENFKDTKTIVHSLFKQ